ncbi:MAG: tetratricopeptide repeat protein [Caldithrix sp.]|nr:MAG: tetratricopeptide repeat protein [Caldithrix sp.]
MIRNPNRWRAFFSIFVVSFLVSSCAYFNTFYNTKKVFNEAKKERKKRIGDKPTSSELQKYDKTIEKASKILEVYPNSKYVDDAVMILGECFYYKGENVRAQRKFHELVTYFPESEYFLKAKIWLAKTDIKLRDYPAARLNLRELLSLQKLKRSIRTESRYLLGESLFEEGRFSEAATEYETAAVDAKDKLIKTNAYLKLGECQIINEEFAAAITSFRNATRYSPDKDLKFDSRLNLGKALKLAGDFKDATRICSQLLENFSYRKQHGLVKLEIADCVYHEGLSLYDKLKDANVEYSGKIKQALDAYQATAEEFKKTKVSAAAYYQMAKIYEEDLADFNKAMVSYNKVRGEYPKSEWVPEATKKANDIGDLIRLKSLVRKSQGKQLAMSSGRYHQLSELELLLLEHGVHPELRFMQRQKKTAKLDLSTLSAEDNLSEKEKKKKSLDELVANKLQLAEVYLFQFNQIDSALFEYDEIDELFPSHPETAKAIYSSAFIYENEFQNKSRTDSLLYTLLQRFPDSYQAQDARKKLGLPLKPIINGPSILFRKAEAALFNEKNVQNAISGYEAVLAKYPDSEYAPKALFALGWVHDLVTLDKEKATVLYEEIQNKYPNSKFARLVARKLRAVKIAQKIEAEKNKKQPEPTESTSKDEKQKELLEEELDLEQKLKAKESKKAGKKKEENPPQKPVQ